MTDMEICRLLRRSVLNSIAKGYHNSYYFASLAAKAKASKEKKPDTAAADPDDFGVDNRPKTSKAEKRARKLAALNARALAAQQSGEFQRALSWARHHSPGGYKPRMACLFLDGSGLDDLMS